MLFFRVYVFCHGLASPRTGICSVLLLGSSQWDFCKQLDLPIYSECIMVVYGAVWCSRHLAAVLAQQ